MTPVLDTGAIALAVQDLPHGPVPPALEALEAAGTAAGNPGLAERVRALVTNAGATEEQTPLTAAACWHEAGRLLGCRLGRPGEAWLCHSRALALQPEHRAARQALRRLATGAGDPRLLAGILDGEIERTTDDAETAALLVERASAEAAAGDVSAALGTLRTATGIRPLSPTARLLQLALVPPEVDDAELADALRVIADSWPGDGEPGVRLMLALIEERLGRHDDALARLTLRRDGEHGPLFPACLWAAARLSLRTGQPARAKAAIDELERAAGLGGHEDLARAMRRLGTALSVLSGGEEPAVADAADAAAAEPSLIAALRSSDHRAEGRLLRLLADTVTTPTLREALLANARATGLAAGDDRGAEPAAGAGSPGLVGRVLGRLLPAVPGGDGPADPGDGHPGGDILRALEGRDAARVAAAVDALRDRGADDEERWNLAVLGAWVTDERVGDPQRAVAGLVAAADSLDRAPLPRLIRARVPDHGRLADLALAEADHAQGPSDAALKLAWAGHHATRVDAGRGAELYRRALEIDPACPLALAALSRGTVDHRALAVAHTSAAAETDGDDRFGHLVSAGAHLLALGDGDGAASAFDQALDLRPEDIDLRIVLLRMALDRPSLVTGRILEIPDDSSAFGPRLLCTLGILALGLDPGVAADAFLEALALDPDDPLARHGHTEALLAAGRASIVSAEILASLDAAADPEERARLLLRLADIDARHGGDAASATLSLLSLAELLPGHRPTLTHVALHTSRQGRRDELPPLLDGLARSLDDPADGAALAQVAWQGTAEDLNRLRHVVGLGAATPIHLAQLEALTDSPDERVGLLRAMTDALGETPARLARLAAALEDAGDLPGAIGITERLTREGRGDAAVWSALLRLKRAADDVAGQADALAGLARACRVDEHRVRCLLDEARVAREGLGDSRRAAACCVSALEIDPACEEAYRIGRALFEEQGDIAGLARLVTQVIRGIEAAPAKHRMLLELADIRLSIGEADGAKIALGLALELAPDDIATRRRLAGLHVRDREWTDAIEHLMEAARRNRDPEAGPEIFFELGTLYADHTDRLDLAEKSFVKVLGWNREHFAAMERLVDVYARMDNWQRSAQALERLVAWAGSPAVKVAKLVALAGVLDTRLSRPKDAERLLNEARGIEPMGIGPIRGLADLYTKQRDTMALNVLLDQALAGHAAALEADPDRADLYAGVHHLLAMKAEDTLASLAVGVLDLLGARGDFPDILPDVIEVHWQGGARAADPSLADLFCPKAVPSGLRETLRAVEEPVARSLGASAKQVDLPRDTRVDRKHPLMMALGLLAPAFGIRGEIACHRVAGPGIRFAPGSPGIALVPEGVLAGEDPALINFAAGSILALAREGLALATIVDEDRLRRIVAGLVRLSVPGYAPPGIDPGVLDEEAASLRRGIPDKIVARVAPFAFECGSALENPHLRRNLLTVAHRVGCVTAGSLTGALRALAVEHGLPVTPLSALPGAGSLIAFAFGKDHLELRRRMGV